MSAFIGLELHVGKIDELETSYDAYKYLKYVADEAGFERFCVLSMQTSSSELSQLSLVNNWNQELLHNYDGEELADHSPILEKLKNSARPEVFKVGELPQNRTEKKKRICIELFRDFNMLEGVCIPVQNIKSVKGGVIFSSANMPNLKPDDLYSLHVLSTYLFEKISQTEISREVDPPDLTDREIDCLSWTAVGKTSSEIAVILDLSNHTINHYLISAARKLDAVNRVQAVAKAIRLNILKDV